MTSYDAGISPFGQMALESASANPVSSHDRDPLITGPGRFSEPVPILALPTGQQCCHHHCDLISWENTGEVSVAMSHLSLERLPICSGLTIPTYPNGRATGEPARWYSRQTVAGDVRGTDGGSTYCRGTAPSFPKRPFHRGRATGGARGGIRHW